MNTPLSHSFEESVKPILGAVRTAGTVEHPHDPRTRWPFVTISRQAGIDVHGIAAGLADALSGRDPDRRPWQTLDRELMERVASEHSVSGELEEASHSWLADFFSGMSLRDQSTDEFVLFRRVAATVHALAQAGRVVLVGAGGPLITADVPGGIHVRIVARDEDRVAGIARMRDLPPAAAEEELRRLDANRAAFYRRYFPGASLGCERFTLTLNASLLTESQMILAILPAVPRDPDHA